MIENNDFIAISNHIGVLTMFSDQELQVDETAVAKLVHFGWFAEDSTPILGIRRVPAATHLRLSAQGVTSRQYMDLSELYGTSDDSPDFESTLKQMMIVNRNLDSIVNRTPTVFLSGGQDSRMTAAAWLAGGASARVVTYGNLSREAEIAIELMRLYSVDHDLDQQGIHHEVRTKSNSTVSMSLADRLDNAFDMWDGDAPPVKIRGAVRPMKSKSFSVSGLGGEITHGHYYGTDNRRKSISNSNYPLEYLNRVFNNSKVATREAANSMSGFMERKMEDYQDLGLGWYEHLDFFFLDERMRRGAPQSLHTISPVPLCVPEFQRMAFQLSVEEKIDKVALTELVSRAIPRWADISTYKPTKEEKHADMKTGNRLWLTDPEHFYHALENPAEWDRFMRPEVINENLCLIQEGGLTQMYESRFTFAIWIDRLYEHVANLEKTRHNILRDLD